jgi:hypothetical protein
MNRVAIMQPYFLPYIGYFQLIHKVDQFVIYDDVQFTKKGWINRNSTPVKNGIWKFTVACNSSPESSRIFEKIISPEFNRDKFITRIRTEYRKLFAENPEAFELLEQMIGFEDNNLFNFIANSIRELANYLNIPSSRITVSSDLGDFTHLKAQDKVLAICSEINATHYLNPISGQHMYSEDIFKNNGIELEFFQPDLDIENNFETNLIFSIMYIIICLPREKVIQLSKLGKILKP